MKPILYKTEREARWYRVLAGEQPPANDETQCAAMLRNFYAAQLEQDLNVPADPEGERKLLARLAMSRNASKVTSKSSKIIKWLLDCRANIGNKRYSCFRFVLNPLLAGFIFIAIGFLFGYCNGNIDATIHKDRMLAMDSKAPISIKPQQFEKKPIVLGKLVSDQHELRVNECVLELVNDGNPSTVVCGRFNNTTPITPHMHNEIITTEGLSHAASAHKLKNESYRKKINDKESNKNISNDLNYSKNRAMTNAPKHTRKALISRQEGSVICENCSADGKLKIKPLKKVIANSAAWKGNLATNLESSGEALDLSSLLAYTEWDDAFPKKEIAPLLKASESPLAIGKMKSIVDTGIMDRPKAGRLLGGDGISSHSAINNTPSTQDDKIAELIAQRMNEKPAAMQYSDNSTVGNPLQIVSHRASELATHAMGMLGIHYRRGKNTPETGLDCAGMVRYVFKQATGRELPRSSAEISQTSQAIEAHEMQPGDLVFYNTMRRGFAHVGIYLGDNKFVHVPAPGEQVRIESMEIAYWKARFNGARRVSE